MTVERCDPDLFTGFRKVVGKGHDVPEKLDAIDHMDPVSAAIVIGVIDPASIVKSDCEASSRDARVAAAQR